VWGERRALDFPTTTQPNSPVRPVKKRGGEPVDPVGTFHRANRKFQGHHSLPVILNALKNPMRAQSSIVCANANIQPDSLLIRSK
jgi:hypothetical protein